MADKEEVVWKTYPGIDFLQANQFGKVRTLDHYTEGKDGKKYLIKGHILKQSDRGHGYLRVGVSVNGKRIDLYVHRIVATCFLPNSNNLPEINHKDNNPKNNCVSNLEWCDHKYNIAFKEKYGISAAEACGCPVFAVNLKTLEVLHFESQHEAARQLGLNQSHINNVLKGQRKQTGGFWFCYADENAVKNVRAKFGEDVANQVEKITNKL